LKKKLLKHING